MPRLLKIVAIVDAANSHVKELIARIEAERYEVEVGGSCERDVTEDAAVGAYILGVDGEQREKARELGHSLRAAGFHTPLWGASASSSTSARACSATTCATRTSTSAIS